MCGLNNKATLKDISFKSSYWSDEDDLLQDFYIPALSISKTYKRIAGFFSSTTLAVAAKGIAAFINNGGKMYLVTSVVFSREDKESIENALKENEDRVLEEISNIEDELKRNHVSMLCWMIKKGALKIKIAVLPNGIAHQKIGILEDSEGNLLSFTGSENETASGWLYNDEAFHVFKSWEDDLVHLNDDIRQFNILWDGQTKKSKIFSISEAFEEKLIQIAPKDEKEFNLLSSSAAERMLDFSRQRPSQKKLHDYQNIAIQKWKNNGFIGILEMATGTGKTFTSLNALKELLQERKRILVVIVVPYLHLITQWEKEFLEFFGNGFFINEAHSGETKWQAKLNESIQNFAIGVIDKLAIFTIYDTFSSEKFNCLINKYLEGQNDVILIADEVHHLGAEDYQNGMNINYKYRLGLTATPTRWFDEDGTNKLCEYFDKTVFKFAIKDAIPKYLVPYNYYPEIVYMSDGELEEYLELFEKISKVVHYKNEAAENKYLKLLLMKRAKIIINNEEKKEGLKRILIKLREEKRVDHLLIYCSPEQIAWSTEILNELDIFHHKFTFEENKNERKRILEAFEYGDYKVLTAIRCLDEGVDIPSVKTAIILASSTNPTQYIQRRGRVLRKYPGKEEAEIFDFFVLPKLNDSMDKSILSIEQKILKREITRSEEFYKTANNKVDVLLKLSKIMRKYSVYFKGGINE
ncbi:MAG: DEAD/DEAH box helicase family protein [Candidatus Omnitrophica bacterium]|nr:DEAD/DEAH box helicase family protein [Candidatus Omnitrophota bacterium]